MLKEDILQLLKAGKDTYLSGQRISAQLGVSRAAVWKAVEALRKDGYGIDSRSNCGYRLVRVPDVMTQEALSDKWGGRFFTMTVWIPPTMRSSGCPSIRWKTVWRSLRTVRPADGDAGDALSCPPPERVCISPF